MLERNRVPESPWKRQPLSAPSEDESLFAEPPLGDAAQLVQSNQSQLRDDATDLQGRTLQQLRTWTRETAYQAAREYTAALIDNDVPSTDFATLIASGHQPTLFHPGVWAKNFVIGQLASETAGVGLNLVVDNDTLAATRIRVPTGDRNHPATAWFAFDEARPPQPWEDAEIKDRSLFESFGNRVTEAMTNWKITPIATEFWPDAVACAQRSQRLVDCLTGARQRLERRWGVTNLELPISRLCQLDAFHWFASHLLAQLPRFQDIYNQTLREYRQAHRIRNRMHPVPDLKNEGEWLEAPFWIWRTGELRRRRLLAKQVAGEVWLSHGDDVFAKLPLSLDKDACCAVDVLRELPRRGFHLRTRALTTTLFARICLADLFVHGIGGAKYDEMTDRILTRFFGLTPPAFLTVSATLFLTGSELHDVQPDDERRLRFILRDLNFNAQRHLADRGEPHSEPLVAAKRQLIAAQRAADEARLSRPQRRLRSGDNAERFRRFREINSRLLEHVSGLRRDVELELETVQSQLRANAVLQDREFAFCLYPEEKLRSFMSRMSDVSGP